MRHQLVLVTAILTVATFSSATNFNVNSTLDEIDADTNDPACISTPSGVCTLRAAIMQANKNADEDTITLPAGVYTLTIAGADENNAERGDLDIRASVTIHGSGMYTTIVDAAGLDRVFEIVLGDSVNFIDMTIRNGSAVTETGNRGGGVYHGGVNLGFARVRLTGNLANAGGGLLVAANSQANLQESIIDNNALTTPMYTNAYGSGVYVDRGSLGLVTSTVTGNSNAVGTNAAVFLENCSNGSTSSISASTIAENNVGGVYSYNCDFTVRNATIVGNSGVGLGFGMYEGLSYVFESSNTIIANNSANDCGFYNASPIFSFSLDSDDSCGLSAVDDDLPGTDPVLLPLRNWGGKTLSMYPKPGESPVIDAGGGTFFIFDQRYVMRPVDGDGDMIPVVDMGSVEAGELIFWGGFETGTTDEWSVAANRRVTD